MGKTAHLGAVFPAPSSLPDFLADGDSILDQKTTSGDYAILSQLVVHQLLHAPRALQLFAMSKYGCCDSNLANYNWMAAMQLLATQTFDTPPRGIDAMKEAKTNTAMFQLWGGAKGDGNCEDILQDAPTESTVLTSDKSTCYRIEHPLVTKAVLNPNSTTEEDWNIPRRKRTFRGGDVMKHIRNARKAGFLFARRFDSKNKHSMTVLGDIEREWITNS